MKRNVLTLIFVIGLISVWDPGEARGQKIYFLMVSDTADPTLDNGCLATVAHWRTTLQDLIPPDQYEFLAIGTANETNGKWITEDLIEEWLTKMRQQARAGDGIQEEDTLVCLYHGHGGRSFFGSHYMQLSNDEWMYSSDLQDLVDAVPCRLKVIMTCSCNAGLLDVFFGEAAFPEWDAQNNGIAPVMKSLFLDHKGLLHMNSAWPGHYSYSDVPENNVNGPRAGSWFFNEFLNHCRGNPQSQPSWRDVDEMLDEQLTNRFKDARSEGRINHAHRNYLSHQEDAKIITYSFAERR